MKLIMEIPIPKNINEIRIAVQSHLAGDAYITTQSDVYCFTEKVLCSVLYPTLRRDEKGIVREYIMLMTRYSKSQIARFIKQYEENGRVHIQEYERHVFHTTYTREDIILLAKTDMAASYPNGFALKHTLKRMYEVYSRQEFIRLKDISVSHIYNLRETPTYQRIAKDYTKTKPHIADMLGARKKPEP